MPKGNYVPYVKVSSIIFIFFANISDNINLMASKVERADLRCRPLACYCRGKASNWTVGGEYDS